MSSNWQWLKDEFTRENMHLSGYDFRRFYVFWWPIPPLLNMIYRLVLAIYVDFWLCYFVKENILTTQIDDDLPWIIYLTHWTYLLTAVYQTSYALICINFHSNQYIRRGHSIIHALDRQSHSAIFPQLSGTRSQQILRHRSNAGVSRVETSESEPLVRDWSPLTSTTSSGERGQRIRMQSLRERRPSSSVGSATHFSLSDIPSHRLSRARVFMEFGTEDEELPWYLKAIQILLCIISPTSLIVSAVYYLFLLPEDGEAFSRENLHMHFMNSVMIITEHLVNALPVRLMHVIYPLMFLLAYTAFTLCYWMYDHTKVIYPGVLNWNTPYSTLGMLLAIAFIILPGAQLIFYAIYHIKVALYEES